MVIIKKVVSMNISPKRVTAPNPDNRRPQIKKQINGFQCISLKNKGLDSKKIDALTNDISSNVDSVAPYKIDLSQNWFSPECADALCDLIKSTSIHTLSLSHSYLGDEGISKISVALKENPIVHLRLDNCLISNDGANSLSGSLSEKCKSLSLMANQISLEGARPLIKACHDHNICIELVSNQLYRADVDDLKMINPSLILMPTDPTL